MMKRLFSICTLLLVAVGISAAPVDSDQARRIAEHFLGRTASRSVLKGTAPATAVGKASLRFGSAATADPTWYAFNFDGGGFVVVAGDDSVEPILGWSRTGRFVYDGAPENLRWWMDGIGSAIAAIRSGEASAAGSAVQKRWIQPRRVGKVEVQYETAKWSQEAPYNNECPMIGSNRAVTGCVATAAAIVCRYFRWPDAGTGTTAAYQYTNENKETQTIGANTLGRAYDWANMPLNYGSSYSSAQGSAVAALMYDLGTMSKMEYGYDDGSGAYDIELLAGMQKHFKYNKKARYEERACYDDAVWTRMLRDNIKNVGPMPYGGSDKRSGGHEFVLDGYTEDNYFGVNWGWGGDSDGYFTLNSMTLSTYNFSEYQSTLFDLAPDRDATTQYEDYLALMPYSTYLGITTEASSFSTGTAFTVKVGDLYNAGTQPFSGKVWVALYDRHGQWKENVSDSQSLTNLPNFTLGYLETESTSGLLKYWRSISCKINGPIRGGDRLRIHYEGAYSSGWARADVGAYDEIVVSDAAVYTPAEIAAGTALSYDTASATLTLTSQFDLFCQVKDASGAEKMKSDMEADKALVLNLSSLPKGRYTLVLNGGGDDLALTLTL